MDQLEQTDLQEKLAGYGYATEALRRVLVAPLLVQVGAALPADNDPVEVIGAAVRYLQQHQAGLKAVMEIKSKEAAGYINSELGDQIRLKINQIRNQAGQIGALQNQVASLQMQNKALTALNFNQVNMMEKLERQIDYLLKSPRAARLNPHLLSGPEIQLVAEGLGKLDQVCQAKQQLYHQVAVTTTAEYDASFLALTKKLADIDALRRKLEAIQDGHRPPIVCLCGSTRFWRTFQEAGLRETLEGKIVLSIGAASGTDDQHFGNLSREEYDQVKAMLDQLHMEKIKLADEVLILNVDGYIGESTGRELAYARELGKVIRFWEGENGRT